jgi:uncharacterized protein (DUF302 family)
MQTEANVQNQAPAAAGLITRPSKYSVKDSIGRIESIAASKGMTIFARIDQKAEAAKVNIEMRPTQVLLFGNPRAGTPLMLAAPTIAIDLPLRVAAWEGESGAVWVAYNSPDYLKERHHVPEGLMQNISGVGPLVEQALR